MSFLVCCITCGSSFDLSSLFSFSFCLLQCTMHMIVYVHVRVHVHTPVHVFTVHVLVM